jgi:hypothetical protein
MRTLPKWSMRYVLLGLGFGTLVVLAIFCVVLPLACIYWTWMALRKIESVIRSSSRRLLNSGYGWSKRQKTLLPRSAYTWMAKEFT